MFISFISIVVLSFLFTKYLYRLMYVQKVLKVFLPKDIYIGAEETWKACSASTGVSMTDDTGPAAPEAGNKKNNSSGNSPAPAAEAPKNNA